MKRKIYPYVCSICAKNQGGTWPEGHCATFHTAKCEYCKEQGKVAHISDWNWPKEHYIGKEAGDREL